MTLLPLPQILPYQDHSDPRIQGQCAAGYGHLSLGAMPWELKEEMCAGGFTGMKASSTRRVLMFEEDVHAAAPMRLFAKRNLARSGLKALAYRLYRSKARREWDAGWALVRRGILTGRPVLVAERRAGGGVQENYLITEAIAAETTLLLHLREHVKERGEDPAPLLRGLAAFLRELHDIGFCHDDLSADHIWVTSEQRFGLIDVDQGAFRRRVSSATKVKNLFQILRSIPPKHLLPEQREAFLALFFGEQWPVVRDSTRGQIERLAAAKGARDVL